MAKKKATRKKPGPAPKPEGRKSARVVILCRPEYKAWLNAMAKAERKTVPDLIDTLLAMHARARLIDGPPER